MERPIGYSSLTWNNPTTPFPSSNNHTVAVEGTQPVMESVADGSNQPRVRDKRIRSVRRRPTKVYMVRAKAASLVNRTRSGTCYSSGVLVRVTVCT